MTPNRIDLDTVPVIILCRDRLVCLRGLVTWLEEAGLGNIIIVDINSSYEPLGEYLRTMPHRVLRLHENVGPWAVWENREIQETIQGRYYVVSDPDVVPDPGCPPDVLQRFHELLQKYPGYAKVGFGLRIDDIPETYKHRSVVLNWEKQFWNREIEPGVYEAPIDTTFALYRPSSEFSQRALRTGQPYVARHLSWYLNLAALPEDEQYYQSHADPELGNWRIDLPAEMRVYEIANPVKRYITRRLIGFQRSLAKRNIRVGRMNRFGR